MGNEWVAVVGGGEAQGRDVCGCGQTCAHARAHARDPVVREPLHHHLRQGFHPHCFPHRHVRHHRHPRRCGQHPHQHLYGNRHRQHAHRHLNHYHSHNKHIRTWYLISPHGQ
eukprot:2342339-Pyramimonas_sp.AAC.1